MTLLVAIKLTRDDSPTHGKGFRWSVQIGARTIEGWAKGERVQAWTDAVTIAGLLHAEMPEVAA